MTGRARGKADGKRGAVPSDPRRGAGRPEASSGSDREVQATDRAGLALAGVFAAIGLVFLVLAAARRDWPALLAALDFLTIGAVLAWALRGRARGTGLS